MKTKARLPLEAVLLLRKKTIIADKRLKLLNKPRIVIRVLKENEQAKEKTSPCPIIPQTIAFFA